MMSEQLLLEKLCEIRAGEGESEEELLSKLRKSAEEGQLLELFS